MKPYLVGKTTRMVNSHRPLVPSDHRGLKSGGSVVKTLLLLGLSFALSAGVGVADASSLIASGDQEGGRIQLVNVDDKSATVLFPTSTRTERHDTTAYPTCPGPIDPGEGDEFRAHGLYLEPGSGGLHTLYVVHHGFRESIEVFELDARADAPALTWIGCTVARL